MERDLRKNDMKSNLIRNIISRGFMVRHIYCFSVLSAILICGQLYGATYTWTPGANGGDGSTWDSTNINWDNAAASWTAASHYAVIGSGNPQISGSVRMTGFSCSGNIGGSGSLRIGGAGITSTLSGNLGSGIGVVYDQSSTFIMTGINNSIDSLFRFNGTFRLASADAWRDNRAKVEHGTEKFTFEFASADETFTMSSDNMYFNTCNELILAAIGDKRRISLVVSGANNFQWSGSRQIINNLTFGNANSTHTLVFGSNINLNSATNNGNTLGAVNGSSRVGGEVSGRIYGNPGDQLTKTGTGTLLLSGISDYSGNTSVRAGNLLIDGALTASCNIYVMSGTYLGGNGSISGNINILSGGTIVGGNVDAVGALTCGANLTLASSSSNMQVFISGLGGVNYNQIIVSSGTVTLNNATLVLNDTNATGQPGDITILNNQGTGAINGIFNGLPQGESIMGTSGRKWSISYTGGPGNNDIVINSTPKGMMLRFH